MISVGWLCHAQPSALDLTFNPGTGATEEGIVAIVRSIFVESNGQIIVGGDFQTFNGQSFNRIARLNADGSIDTNFFVGQGPQAFVYAVAAQTNGMLLVGGSFNLINGVTQPNLARLRIDGSLDITFTPNIQENITSILQQPDGNILIVGSITQVNGDALTGIARLTFNGALDTSFSPALTSGQVSAMALDATGNILVAGEITIGTNQLSAARLAPNGSQDTTFSLGSIDGAVNQIGIETNGEIIITGNFTEINGYSRVGIAELFSDGQVDPNFRPNPSTSYGTLLAIEQDGRILTSGYGMTRVNTDGSVDTTFTPAISSVNCVVIQPDGRILVGGGFSTVNGNQP